MYLIAIKSTKTKELVQQKRRKVEWLELINDKLHFNDTESIGFSGSYDDLHYDGIKHTNTYVV